jgi:hypothetical protein
MMRSTSLASASVPTLAYSCGVAVAVRVPRSLRNIRVTAQRAVHEPAAELALEILVRGKPALEAVAILAPEIKDNHVSLRNPSMALHAAATLK